MGPGMGIFTETLVEVLADDLAEVRPIGIGQDLLDYDEQAELEKLGRALAGTGGDLER
jgi:hypothetical protein